VSGNISSLVVTVNGDIESKELYESIIVSKSEKSGEIMRIVLVQVDGGEFAFAVNIVEDATSNVRQFSNPGESC
jgi:hypothetical protein